MRNCNGKADLLDIKYLTSTDGYMLDSDFEPWVQEDNDKNCKRRRIRGPKMLVISLDPVKGQYGEIDIYAENWKGGPMSILYFLIIFGIVVCYCTIAFCNPHW